MLDPERLRASLEADFRPPPKNLNISLFELPLHEYDNQELLSAKTLIERILAERKGEEIDVEQEYLIQLGYAREIQKRLNEEGTRPGELAQAMNSVTKILTQLAEARETLYNTEMLRRIEREVVEIFRAQPPKIRDEFLKRYESAVRAAAKK